LAARACFENGLTFVLEPRDFAGRQRIRQPECDEIDRAFFHQMRQPATEMQPANERIRRRNFPLFLDRFRHWEKMTASFETGKFFRADLQWQTRRVAADVPSSVEGGILPPETDVIYFTASGKFGRCGFAGVFFRRARRLALWQAGGPPLQEKKSRSEERLLK
jgi:hypothetical protein